MSSRSPRIPARHREDAPLSALAVVAPGLEQPAAAELEDLGAVAVVPLRRAVSFRCDLAGFYRIHLQARLPFRLLRRIASFPCRGPQDLHAGVQAAFDRQDWLSPQRTFRVDVSGGAPGLGHSHFTALAVKNALVDLQRQRWGERSSIDRRNPDLVLHLHLAGGMAELSLESAGSSLHRRGWRAAMGQAPLKESLAAGLMRLTGWEGSVPLVDPLCGSGTLLIEAVCAVLGRAPGLFQYQEVPLPLERWPDFDAELWQQEKEVARSLARTTLPEGRPLAPVMGMEKQGEVLSQARHNAEAAGVASWIAWQEGDFRSFLPPPGPPGVMVCNPPHGIRLGRPEELEALYSDLGRMVRERCSGWRLWLLSGNPGLTGALRLRASRRIPVSNGGIDCRWLLYEIR